MARRPTSDHFPAGSGTILSSREAGMEEEAEEEDRAPIISLSKSHMNVLMSAPPCKRDPAWARLDMRRSSSQGTAVSQSTLTLQQLCGLKPHRGNSPKIVRPTHPRQLAHTRLSGMPTDQWMASVDRWSVCSGSVCSGSSTPDSVVWRGTPIRPCSGIEGALFGPALDSPMSRPVSPPPTPSPCISPLHTPTTSLSPNHFPSPLSLSPNPYYQNHSLVASPLPAPLPSHTPVSSQQVLPGLPLPAQENPLRVSSPRGLDVEGLEECSPDRSVFGESPPELSPNFSPGATQRPRVGADTPMDSQVCVSKSQNNHFQFQLPWPLKQRCMTSADCSTHRPKLPSSLSDSRLNICYCNSDPSKPEFTTVMQLTKAHTQGGLVLKDEGTMTSQAELVDAAVQAMPSPGSWGSHSLLGSPPGSRLNLRSSVGSHSNLVSPSSSMFRIDSSVEEVEEEEEDLVWEVSTPPVIPGGRRRSCLKVHGDESRRSGPRNEMGRRRSSMKQVQWDEDGMTWDVHGASLDPEELSTAIQRHLQLKTQDIKQNKGRAGPRTKTKSKKKTSVITGTLPSDASGKATNGSEETPTRGKETVTFNTECESGNVPADGQKEQQTGKSKNGEVEEEVSKIKKVEVESEREDGFAEEDEEVYGEDAARERKASTFREVGWNRKRGGKMMRSLRRPKWCVRSNSDND